MERWFGLITQQAIRLGSFSNVRELPLRTNDFVEGYNENACPFSWVATAESVLARIERLCKPVSGTQHQSGFGHQSDLRWFHSSRGK